MSIALVALAAVLGAVLGAILGSFIATLCVRWPRGEQVATGRSRCDDCGDELRPLDLVPIISCLLARGRCRACGAKIDPTHLRVELAAAAIGGAALAISPDARGAALALFSWLMLGPALLDARHYWLPDRLTALLAVAGIAAGGMLSGETLIHRLIGGPAGFLALALLAEIYRRVRGREGLGGGDAKFLGAIGLWTGWAALPVILLIASVIGLAGAAINRRRASEAVPFGTLLALGAGLWAAGNLLFPGFALRG